jgi:VanZ family protein
MLKERILPWIPAVVMMVVIFAFSSTPSSALPNLGFWDALFKKSGHFLGYALLALAFWFGFRFEGRRWWLVILLSLVYATLDEFHQSFVPGRHPSLVDIFLFDLGGACLSVLLVSLRKKKILQNQKQKTP